MRPERPERESQSRTRWEESASERVAGSVRAADSWTESERTTQSVTESKQALEKRRRSLSKLSLDDDAKWRQGATISCRGAREGQDAAE